MIFKVLQTIDNIMPSNDRIHKNIFGGLDTMQWCIILLAAFSLLCDSALAACGASPTIDNAFKDTETAVEVRYKCKDGYEPGATKTRATCDGSNWVFDDNRPLVCRRVSCGTPPDKEHASYKETSFQFGDEVYYVCDTGYKQYEGVKNYNYIQCQPTGKWTVIGYTCGPVTCSSLSDPANGKVVIVQGSTGKYDYKHIYRFTCNTGYMSKGRQTVEVTCTASGKWSEENVKCEEGVCPEPKTPENGVKLNEGNKYGDLREYRCNDKYEMVGVPSNSVVSYCQKDGKWSGTYPTCRFKRIPCNRPAGPANGYAERVNDDEYRMKCNAGYKLKSGNSYETVTCQNDGTWSFNPAVCEEVKCGQPSIPANGELVANDGKTYTVRCKDGFKLKWGNVGDTVSETCQNNGQWTKNNNPVCEEVTCKVPPTAPANGKIEQVDKTYKITCNEGYMINGGATVTCVNDRWSPTTTGCEKKPSSGGEDKGKLIGIIVGSVIGGLIVVAIIAFFIRRSLHNNNEVSSKRY